MSQNARESLSALMDDEGDELELRRVLKSLSDAPDAAEAWRRYHLMRSLMRREPDIDVSTDLSAGIMARLKDEPAPILESDDAPAQSAPRSLPFARGAGIAAAVSLLVITGVQFYPGGGGDAEVAATPGAVQPAPAAFSGAGSLAGQAPQARPSLVDLPLFQAPLGVSGGGQGLMTVGAGGEAPMFMAPNPRQSLLADEEQARLLQSYLDRHAEGAAYRSGDTWMPLLRATGGENLGQR